MPQRPGNHGRVIPRDRQLLRRLYWTENRSLTEVAAIFDVTFSSVRSVFNELDIPRRGAKATGHKGSRWTRCIKCGAPVEKIKHAKNGSAYGKRCRAHQREHYRSLARIENARPARRKRKQQQYERWYYEGPINLTGEGRWISKGRALLRGARRLLLRPNSPEALRSLKAASELERILRT